jgi:hypothetical protein
MPLSASDVAYINKVMDRHLRDQRSWPWMRYFALAMSVLMMGMGIWGLFIPRSLMNSTFEVFAPASRPADATSTMPVTHDELRLSQEATVMRLEVEGEIRSILLFGVIGGMFFFFLGVNLTGWTLTRWNRHRRDTILITLLRDKFGAELAMPGAGSKPD